MNIKVTIKPKPQKTVAITTPTIRLDAFLKLCDAVQSGGHAKVVVQDGAVKVNNEICLQRGKKLREGDRVQFDNRIYIVAQQGKADG